MFIYAIITCLIILLVLSAVYLSMIAPRIFKKPDLTLFKNTLFAHRGLHDNDSEAPENSMPAFEMAVAAGYGIELDIQLTKDGVPVIFHDMSLERICGRDGSIGDYSYNELMEMRLFKTEQTIPTFERFLEMVNGRVPILVEYKSENTDISVFKKGEELLSEYKGVYFVESFNPLGLRWYKKNKKNIIRGQLSDNFRKEDKSKPRYMFFLKHLMLNFLSKPDFIAYNIKYPKALEMRICRKIFGCPAAAWTVKSNGQLLSAKKYFDVFIFDSFKPKK